MQAVDRLIAVLEAVGEASDPSSAAEVAEKIGLSLSTVSRLMVDFADAGLLHRTERDRRYTLGPRLYALARTTEMRLNIESIAQPELERLRDLSGETVSLHVLRGRQRVCILEVPSLHPLRRVVPIGTSEPVAGSATGAVLISDGHQDLEPIIEDLSKPIAAMFRQAVADARENGWAIVDSDWISGLNAVSAGIWIGGRVDAAISVSGPSNRFDAEHAHALVPEMMRASKVIAARLGG